MKKKILFVVDEKMYGGVSSVLKTILDEINYNKFNVDLLVLHNRGIALNDLPKEVGLIYGKDFFEIVDLPMKKVIKTFNPIKILNKIELVLRMKFNKIEKKIILERKKILSEKYDVEIGFKDGFAALFTAYGDSAKKISWLHTDYNKYDCTAKYKKTFVEVYKKINEVVAITEDVKKSFVNVYKTNKEVVVISNIIDESSIIEKSNEIDINYNKESINFVCVGRVAKVKAYDRLLEQVNKLKKDGLKNNFTINIIGDGDEYINIKNKVKKYALEDNIRLWGYKSNPYPYIKEADMLLLPSLYEGLGVVLIESMILKVPIFATEFANAIETSGFGKYGMVVKNNDEAIYLGLKQLIINKDLIEKYKQNLANYKYDNKEIVMKKIETLLEGEN